MVDLSIAIRSYLNQNRFPLYLFRILSFTGTYVIENVEDTVTSQNTDWFDLRSDGVFLVGFRFAFGRAIDAQVRTVVSEKWITSKIAERVRRRDICFTAFAAQNNSPPLAGSRKTSDDEQSA
jgi:hypothetical protein